MADSEALIQCLNPLIRCLKRMEWELKCPNWGIMERLFDEDIRTPAHYGCIYQRREHIDLLCPGICLKLLDQPIVLPCDHIFCSYCIPILTNNGRECSSCKISFLNQDLRPVGYMKSLVSIYNDMNSAVAANFPQQKSDKFFSDNMVPTSEGPVGTTSVKELLQREVIQNRAGKNVFDLPLGTSNIITPREGESSGPATRSKKCMQSPGNEALVDKEEQCSAPSFGSTKDSDCDNSDNGNGKQIKRSLLAVKEKEVGNKPRKQLDTGKSKRQKLNSECDIEDNGGITTRDLGTPNSNCEHNDRSCSDTYPMDTSRYLSANRVVECVFCHSFRITEASGEMLHYLNGKEVDLEQATQPNVFHVHQKCVGWAPQIYYSGETIKNLERELSRASKINCSSCDLKGAALGCYVKSCKKSYHVPCAYHILDCRWDCENYLMLCPDHSSHKLPCDRSKTKSKNKAKRTLDSSGSSGDLSSPATPEHGHLTMSPIWNREWVFCGSSLLNEEKRLLEKLGCISKTVVSNLWKPEVTHVIASVDESGGCSRTLKVLMAILTGKWILNIEWVKACIEAGHPVPEEPYEVTHDVHGCFDGPKLGRIRVMEKAPKLFRGISFYITDEFQQATFKKYLEDLIVTGGGTLVKKNDLIHMSRAVLNLQGNGTEISPTVFIVYSAEPLPEADSRDLDGVLKQRTEVAEAFAADVCGRAIRHTSLLDSIAACHVQLN